MRTKLYRNWWLFTLKGLFCTLLGVLVILMPDRMTSANLLLIALLISLGGVGLVAGGISHRRFNYEWTWWLLEGLTDVVVGLVLLLAPFETSIAVPFIIGVWILMMGIIGLARSINIHFYVAGNAVFVVEAVFLIVAGLFLVIVPSMEVAWVLWLGAIVVAIYGLLTIYVSFLLKDVDVEEIGEIEDII